MRQQLVIFAKAPALGRVKSRLARGIGAGAALSFYRRTLAALLRRVARDRPWSTALAVAPDRSARDGRIWPPRVPRRAQGAGNLGHRMGRVFRNWRKGALIIVGADIPDITADHIARAFRALGSADVVLGPAPDGGYWLIGAKGTARRGDLFAGVRWSSAHALADTLRNLRGRRVALVDRLDDIDDAPSYRRWRRRRASMTSTASPRPQDSA
jgi:hypothetical protein